MSRPFNERIKIKQFLLFWAGYTKIAMSGNTVDNAKRLLLFYQITGQFSVRFPILIAAIDSPKISVTVLILQLRSCMKQLMNLQKPYV